MLPIDSHDLTQLGSSPGYGYDSRATPGRHEWTGRGLAAPFTDPGFGVHRIASFDRAGSRLGPMALNRSAAAAPERPSRWLRKVFRTSSACYPYGSLTIEIAFAGSSTEVLEV